MKSAYVVTLLFLSAAAGPWLWINLGSKSAETPGIEISVVRDLPGSEFTPVPVSQLAIDKLGTTNLFNGEYHRAGAPAAKVFFADWRPEDGAAATLLMHTPDVCWVQIGWKPTAAQIPARIPIVIDGHELPFECRVFEAPGGHSRELVVWLALVNGSLLEIPPPGESQTSRTAFAMEERWRRICHMLQLARHRTAVHGRKQFVRCSISIGSDLESAMNKLRSFAEEWIAAKVEKPSGVENPNRG